MEFSQDTIEIFGDNGTRHNNDKNNKLREIIVSKIINNEIPIDWYLDDRWLLLKNEIWLFLCELCPFKTVHCKILAGRANNCDFLIQFILGNDEVIDKKVEWKYGVDKIDECPQWVSPMRPSKYMTNDFEEYFYDNYLHMITYPELKPPKEVYFKEIHRDKPECMASFQEQYYFGAKASSKFTGKQEHINYHNRCKEISKNAINKFIQQTDLDVDRLNEYLYRTQLDKVYMCCDKYKIKCDKVNKMDYTINPSSIVKGINSFMGTTLTGKKIKILLRWKNGNGIAFPAFQIK